MALPKNEVGIMFNILPRYVQFNLWYQRDSNLDCRCERQARQPRNYHYHCFTIGHIKSLIFVGHKIFLFRKLYLSKRGHPRLFLIYFRLFKQTLQFLQQINVKNVHPVYGPGIWTHNLRNMSLPPFFRKLDKHRNDQFYKFENFVEISWGKNFK